MNQALSEQRQVIGEDAAPGGLEEGSAEQPKDDGTDPWRAPACSTVLANPATSDMIPTAASDSATMSRESAQQVAPVGAEQQGGGNAEDDQACEPEDETGERLPAHDREPRDRRGEQASHRPLFLLLEKPVTPNETVKKRKNEAIPAAR